MIIPYWFNVKNKPQSSGNPSGPGLADLNFLQLLRQQGYPSGCPCITPLQLTIYHNNSTS